MILADWLDQRACTERLISRGMSPECAVGAVQCFQQAAAALQRYNIAPSAGVVACWAPGRIEVFGKHTDYCGGSSILAAVERGFCLLAAPRDDSVVAIVNPKHSVSSVILDKRSQPVVGHWSNYPHTVVRRFAANFPHAQHGATISLASNLPQSSGMSSSSAFVVSTFLALSRLNDLECDQTYASVIRSSEDLAGYLGTVENGASFGPLAGDRGVGTFGGSEDHTAILCSQPNRLVQYAYCPVRFQRAIELSEDYVFAIASSGVVAEKTGAALEKYNRISAMVRTIVSTWQTATGGDEQSLAAILERTQDRGKKLQDVLARNTGAASTSDLLDRLNHFISESSLIDSLPAAINASTIGNFGKAAHRSHSLACKLLKNQTAETNRLVEFAEQLGARAASAFGAGFGGSVWALVNRSEASDFLKNWKSQYDQAFATTAARSEFFSTNPGIAALTFS